ncbi:hypothetical protein [Halochromatium sp.]
MWLLRRRVVLICPAAMGWLRRAATERMLRVPAGFESELPTQVLR